MVVYNTVHFKGEKTIQKPKNIIGWKNNQFHFRTEPINLVLDELERQFDVTIQLNVKNQSEFVFTGSFNKNTSIESSLNLICKSFNLKFTQLKNGEYSINQ